MLISHLVRRGVNPSLIGTGSGFSRGKRSSVRPKRLFLVGMADSPHFQRWLNTTQNNFPHIKIWVFPSDRPRLTRGKLKLLRGSGAETKVFRLFPQHKINFIIYYVADILLGMPWRAFFLHYWLKIHKPSVVHFHETQHAAYIYNYIYDYKNTHSKANYILSTWGSDLTLFSWVEGNELLVKSALSWANVVTAERESEKVDADRLGFCGKFIAPIYITVGQKEVEPEKLSTPSSRRSIIIKGYQHEAGRALNALEAIIELKDQLSAYEILVFSASDSVIAQVDILRGKEGVNIRVLPRMSHTELQEYFKKSRLYIGMSISDGLSTSMVEAMNAGTFPIQSPNSAAGEFILDGISGFIIEPWDIDGMKQAIITAIANDLLVDKAVKINYATLSKKYSFEVGETKLREIYKILQ